MTQFPFHCQERNIAPGISGPYSFKGGSCNIKVFLISLSYHQYVNGGVWNKKKPIEPSQN
jgi:hypothetical protein